MTHPLDFSLSLDPSSNIQMVIWHGTRPYYRISMLNGAPMSGGIYQHTISYETVGSIGNGFYYTYTSLTSHHMYVL